MANGPSTPKGPAGGDELDGQVVEKVKPKSTVPRRYKVLFHNDDYTTMEFVVLALMQFFHKSESEANYIMLTVHKKGNGVAGVYTRDVAETKVEKVTEFARDYGMPLLVTAEPESD
jgi:ATP-dependent Clp protease adaptor protein ClpS